MATFRVSLTNRRSSYLSHVIAVTLNQRPIVHLGSPHLPVLRRVESTDCLVSLEWSGDILLVLWLPMGHLSTKRSATLLAPPPLWLQKHTGLRAHRFAHSPDLWRQPGLANSSYAWSRRLCGITPTINTSLRRANHSSRGVLQSALVSLSIISKNNPQQLQ